MLYFAFNIEKGKIFNVYEGLPENPNSYLWTCINCKRFVVFLEPQEYYPFGYFKHIEGRTCEFTPESKVHKIMKAYFFEKIPHYNAIKDKELEKDFGEKIADVYFLMKNGKEVVVECQNSIISSREIDERNKFYNKKDIYILWILNGNGPCVSNQKSPRNQDRVSILKHERKLHNLYRGRVYYMNVSEQRVIHPPYALHLAPYCEIKEHYDPVFLKHMASTIHTPIKSLSFNLYDFKKKKLARFFDKNLKHLCFEHINENIKNYCIKYQKTDGNGVLVKIPLDEIINPIKNRFGYNLPYSLIRFSKKNNWNYIKYMVNSQNQYVEGLEIKISNFL
jgi:hypothetical protein